MIQRGTFKCFSSISFIPSFTHSLWCTCFPTSEAMLCFPPLTYKNHDEKVLQELLNSWEICFKRQPLPGKLHLSHISNNNHLRMTFIGVVSGLRKHRVPHGTSTTSAGEGISVALGSGFPGPAGRPALRRTGTLGNWNTKSIFLFSNNMFTVWGQRNSGSKMLLWNFWPFILWVC